MRCKADIEYHRLGYGYQRVPAVNVKNYDSIQTGYKKWLAWGELDESDTGFNLEWIEAQGEEYQQNVWEHVCEYSWEDLQDFAREIYGKHVKVYSEGRSGGWAYIDGINTDVDSWDAIEFTQWKRFAKYARETADDIMAQVVSSMYINRWEDQKQEAYDTWVNAEPQDVAEVLAGIA